MSDGASECLHPDNVDAAFLGAVACRAGLLEASIVVRSLAPDGTSAVYEPERPLYPASMIKLPVALALSESCRAGALRLSATAEITPANLTANDLPSAFSVGVRATLGELARAMLAASDNVATNVLIDVLGREAITHVCRSHGLTSTAVRRKLSGALPLIADPQATGRNSHPAADAARLLHVVADRAEQGSDFIYDALLAQRWNEKLTPGFDANDSFAHKTGDTDEVSHDGGILTLADGRRYIVVVYTALPSLPSNDARFAAFARALRRRLGAPVTARPTP